MNERRTDFELLKSFTRLGDQESFAGVVRRHLDLVYATALRKVEDQGAAQEIAQNVFATLARKSWMFAPDDSLPAWLYRATLLEAKEWWRGEVRRRRREQTAAELGTTMKTTEESTAFRALVPLLDEALLSLREQDRAALLLRFYESQSLRDVGASLGVGEDAAQKRVAGALEKLSRFFQRRGFKSATVAAASAALQQTARSAPAVVAESLASAAMRIAPPAMGGLAGGLARMASLTKVQTAAVCLSLALIPVAWQWNDYRQAAEEAARIRIELAEARMRSTEVTTDLERLRDSVGRMQNSMAAAKELADQRAKTLHEFEAWKSRLRSQLMSDNYRWPDDSPFVRIPKSAASHMHVDHPMSPPGVFRREERELLGLTPQERQRVEDALHRHFSSMDSMMDTGVYETNRSRGFWIPESAVASKVWAVPALGDGVDALGRELQSTLQSVLGDERWSLIQPQWGSQGTDSLRRILDLDAGQQEQQVGVWIFDVGGNLHVGYGWSGGFSSFSSGGLTLNLFKPNAEPVNGMDPADYLGVRSLPTVLSQRMINWIQAQAASRLQPENQP
jgi:RNA polymerase sigma factor (sigma-70 family)